MEEVPQLEITALYTIRYTIKLLVKLTQAWSHSLFVSKTLALGNCHRNGQIKGASVPDPGVRRSCVQFNGCSLI